MNYLFSAHNENKKQVKGYGDTFDLALSNIKGKFGELQEKSGISLEINNKPKQ